MPPTANAINRIKYMKIADNIILTAFENEYDVRRFTEVKEMIDINREVIFLDVSIDELIGLTEQYKKAGWNSSSEV